MTTIIAQDSQVSLLLTTSALPLTYLLHLPLLAQPMQLAQKQLLPQMQLHDYWRSHLSQCQVNSSNSLTSLTIELLRTNLNLLSNTSAGFFRIDLRWSKLVLADCRIPWTKFLLLIDTSCHVNSLSQLARASKGQRFRPARAIKNHPPPP